MKKILLALWAGASLAFPALAQEDSSRVDRQLSVKVHAGIWVPDQVVPQTSKAPVGFDINYGWMNLSRRSWEQANCFSRAGVYATYYNFNNPKALGQTAGAGLFFEPYFLTGRWVMASVRVSAGLTYLTRVYDAETNPSNKYFSMPISSMIGASLNTYVRLNDRLRLNGALYYNHISNAGTRIPNQGLNIPSVSVGLAYHPQPLDFPSTRSWKAVRPKHRWMARATLMGAVRMLEASKTEPERMLPMYGLNLVGGYRVHGPHVLSGGAEFVDDRHFRNQSRRWGGRYRTDDHRQVTLLLGYEFWQGRFIFSAHHGWNIVRPARYKPATYQRYSLFYRLPHGITVGFGVKAFVDDTKGFNLALGYTF